jgi:hypothetical protein
MSTCRIQDAIPATPFLCPLRQIGLIDTGNVATYPAKKKQKFSPQAADRKLQVAAGKKPSTVYMQGVWSEQHNGIPAPFCLVSLGLHALQLSDIVASGTHRQWDTRCGVLAVVTRSGVVDDECARAHGSALATWVTKTVDPRHWAYVKVTHLRVWMPGHVLVGPFASQIATRLPQ